MHRSPTAIARQRRRLQTRIGNTDANGFFNLLTGPQLLDEVESLLPEHHHTPWGAAINFDGEGSRVVRDFFIHNALYWLTEYRLDGLRLDAVQAMVDDSVPDILLELAEAVQAGPGRHRQVHLVLENDDNGARYLARTPDGAPRWYVAQWNDDFHHVAHLLATGERDGYYQDYGRRPVALLGRCLAEGFGYQGEPSAYRGGRLRGEPSADLPPTAFVDLLQNHDQVGNRAFGERIGELVSPEALRALGPGDHVQALAEVADVAPDCVSPARVDLGAVEQLSEHDDRDGEVAMPDGVEASLDRQRPAADDEARRVGVKHPVHRTSPAPGGRPGPDRPGSRPGCAARRRRSRPSQRAWGAARRRLPGAR